MGAGELSPELTSLYRRVVKRIHPDLAVDEQDRLRCEELTQQANAAYQAGDYQALRAVLDLQHSVEAESEVAKATRTLREYVQARDHERARQTTQRVEVKSEPEFEGDCDDYSWYAEHYFEWPDGLTEEVRKKYFAICKKRVREFEVQTGKSWAQYKREADDTYEEESSNHGMAWLVFFMAGVLDIVAVLMIGPANLNWVHVACFVAAPIVGSVWANLYKTNEASKRRRQALGLLGREVKSPIDLWVEMGRPPMPTRPKRRASYIE